AEIGQLVGNIEIRLSDLPYRLCPDNFRIRARKMEFLMDDSFFCRSCRRNLRERDLRIATVEKLHKPLAALSITRHDRHLGFEINIAQSALDALGKTGLALVAPSREVDKARVDAPA